MAIFSYTNLSTREHPGVRARVEQSRKRFQCDLLEFWRQCRLGRCRQRYCCLGDPHDCFRRHHAAMPRDHAAWLHADILSRTTGTGTAEQALHAFGLSLPARIRPPDAGPSQSPQTDQAASAVVLSHDDDAAGRARRWAEFQSMSPSELMAYLEKWLGKPLTRKSRTSKSQTSKTRPEPAGLPPPPQADAEASVVVSQRESRAAVEAFNERARKGMDYNDIMARLRELGASV